MNISRAIAIKINELSQPVITDYELCLIISRLYVDKSFRGESISVSKAFPSRADFTRNVKRLTSLGILSPHKNFSRSRVFVLPFIKDPDVSDIACCVDPFAYISHMSALSYHGITDRIPNVLFISSPHQKEWSIYAKNKMVKDLKDLGDIYNLYIDNYLPRLSRMNFDKIGKYPVNRYLSLHLGAYKNVKGRTLRVSTIGRTFLDMVREPRYCGGIRHVIDVYKEYAEKYITLIIDEADRHANIIEKMRIGYLLEDICKLHHNRLDEWARLSQRGGSRKLDPQAEFSPKYSERWCISINTD